jgi:hypothetical protein
VAPGPNPPCIFQCDGLSSDYCVFAAVGCPAWMVLWQVRQTARVLRRFLAMSCAHAGGGCPAAARSASLRTWCTCTLAGCSPSSHHPARSRLMSWLPRGRVSGAAGRSLMTALRCRFSGMPPKRATSGFLPSRWVRASKHLRGPCGVAMVAMCLRAIWFTGPKAEAEQIKDQLAAFLRDELALELSSAKTLITHARSIPCPDTVRTHCCSGGQHRAGVLECPNAYRERDPKRLTHHSLGGARMTVSAGTVEAGAISRDRRRDATGAGGRDGGQLAAAGERQVAAGLRLMHALVVTSTFDVYFW